MTTVAGGLLRARGGGWGGPGFGEVVNLLHAAKIYMVLSNTKLQRYIHIKHIIIYYFFDLFQFTLCTFPSVGKLV